MNLGGPLLAVIRRTARALRPWLGEARFEVLVGLGYLGYLPAIERPQTFNEKLLWLKRHYRDPAMRPFADKLQAREAARKLVPDIRLPELIGVYDDPDQVPFADLPNHAVLKSSHGSGHVRVLTRPYDEAAVRSAAAGWLARPYGTETNEWIYRDVPRRLLVERFLGTSADTPTDHKVFVVNGRAVLVQLFSGRFRRLECRMVDTEWRELPVYRGAYPGGPLIVPDPAGLPPRPACLERMLAQAEALGQPFPFVRADFYVVDDEPVFGELTFFPNGGHVEFRPLAFDRELGARLTLPGSEASAARRAG